MTYEILLAVAFLIALVMSLGLVAQIVGLLAEIPGSAVTTKHIIVTAFTWAVFLFLVRY